MTILFESAQLSARRTPTLLDVLLVGYVAGSRSDLSLVRTNGVAYGGII